MPYAEYNALKMNPELWDMFTVKKEYRPKESFGWLKHCVDRKGCESIFYPKVSEFLVNNGLDIEYPEGQSFAVCLSHDVDAVYPPLKHTVLSCLYSIKDLRTEGFKESVLWRKRGRHFSPYNNFEKIIDLEERYNAKSSFYFIANSKDFWGYRYNIEDLENELGFIKDKGFEVGLHGGYYSYKSLKSIAEEKRILEKLLGKKVIGYRNHYLRFSFPETWEHLERAGFKYDTTLGYNDTAGFRNGMCHPFEPYNLNTNRHIDLLEIPLCIMDSALITMKSDINSSLELANALIDATEKFNGVLTLSWHNQNFSCPFRNHLDKLYQKILGRIVEKNAWITSSEEIWKWWKRISR